MEIAQFYQLYVQTLINLHWNIYSPAQLYGDVAVCQILTQAMEYLGIALANIVSFFNPHLIFLSGPLFRI